MNLGSRYSKAFSENLAVLQHRGIRRSDLLSLLICQFGQLVGFAVNTARATFGNHIGHVVLVSTKPEVVRPNTKGIVALMTHALRGWHWTVVKNPGSHVGADHHCTVIPCISRSHTPVASSRTRCDPQPATPIIGKNKHLLPKAFGECFGKALLGEVLRSYVDHVFRSARCALQGPPRFSFLTIIPQESKLPLGFVGKLVIGWESVW